MGCVIGIRTFVGREVLFLVESAHPTKLTSKNVFCELGAKENDFSLPFGIFSSLDTSPSLSVQKG